MPAFDVVLTSLSLTFYVDGKPTMVYRDNPKFDEILRLVMAGDRSAVDLARPAMKIASTFRDESAGTSPRARWFRRAVKELTVSEWGVTYGGEPVHGVVVDRLMEILSIGGDIGPWVRFLTKLMQNPSSTSRNELYLWLEKAGMPIAADGDFLAFKRVRGDFKDIHSGTFDNTPGQIPEMPRPEVDDDRNRTCSEGLHFCSRSYLPNFGGGNQGTDRVVIVKINPADVVSIPSDYDDAKGRTWRYEVMSEISLADAGIPWVEPVSYDYGDNEDYDDTAYDDLDEDDYDEHDDQYNDDEDQYNDGDESDNYDDGPCSCPLCAQTQNDDDDNDLAEARTQINGTWIRALRDAGLITVKEYDWGDTISNTTLREVYGAYFKHYPFSEPDTITAQTLRHRRASTVLGSVVESFKDLNNAEAQVLIAAWS